MPIDTIGKRLELCLPDLLGGSLSHSVGPELTALSDRAEVDRIEIEAGAHFWIGPQGFKVAKEPVEVRRQRRIKISQILSEALHGDRRPAGCTNCRRGGGP